MSAIIRYLLAASALIILNPSQAAIYKYVTPDGEVVYSDAPPPGAQQVQEVELPPLSTYTPQPSPHAVDTGATKPAKHPGYDVFRITSPKDDEPIRMNTGNITIVMELRPALHSGDTIDLVLDGRTIGTGSTTTVNLTNLDRGTHTVEAVIRSPNAKVVARTKPISFHILRAAVGGG